MIIDIKTDAHFSHRAFTLKGALLKHVAELNRGDVLEIERVDQINGMQVPWDKVRSCLSSLSRSQRFDYKTCIEGGIMKFYKL